MARDVLVSTEVKARGSRLALGAAALTVVAWASAFVALRWVAQVFDPGPLVLGRLLVCSAALGAFMLVRRIWVWPTLREWALIVLCGVSSSAWSAVAVPTRWTAARTVEHIADALLFYSGQVARRADRRLPVLRDGRAAPLSEQLDNILTAAHLLAGQLRDLGAARAWHPSGLADASGWAGMAVTELLVHGTDAARAVGAELVLPDEVCGRVVARVFPWIDNDLLLGVTGRLAVQRVDVDPGWWWQSAPVDEWDGHPRKRDVPPGWS